MYRYAPTPHKGRREAVFLISVAVLCAAALCTWGITHPRLQAASSSVSAAAAAVSPVSLAPVSSAASSAPTVDRQSWQLRLVNASHPLPANFSVKTSAVGNVRFDARASGALQKMISACNTEGNHLMACSGWRSISLQTTLYHDEIRSKQSNGLQSGAAVAAAAAVVAPPGTSEHNLGLAVDLGSISNQLLDETFAGTPESRWLVKNAASYGFILRYPKGKEQITGIIFEPWHYRYVGVPTAEEIQRKNLCLEEYLA